MNSIQHRLRFFPITLIGCLTIGIFSNLLWKSSLLNSVLLLIIIWLIWIILTPLSKFFDRLSSTKILSLVVVATLFIFLFQLIILSYFPVSVYHDPYRVLTQAEQLATGNHSWNESTYFWRYPNNVALTYFLSCWFRLTFFFKADTNLSLNILNLGLLDSFIILLLSTLWKISHNKSLMIGTLAFVGLSSFAYTYFLQIFYSDLPAMLGLLIIFRILLFWQSKTKKQKYLCGLILFIIVLLTQIIKPNTIVLLPAIILLIILWQSKHLLKNYQMLIPLVLIIFGLISVFPANDIIQKITGFQSNSAYELPVSSWILTGQTKNGIYERSIISQELKLPNKAVRNKINQKKILTILKKSTANDLLKRWFLKLSIFLNVSSISSWYNGGFRAAPAWYQAYALIIQQIVDDSYQIAVIILNLLLLKRLSKWQPQLKRWSDSIAILLVITTLGFIAFHTVLWETESRYGQMIIPLLLLQLGIFSAGKNQIQSQKSRSKSGFLLTIVMLTLFLAFLRLPNSSLKPKSLVVAAQRSQISTQYQLRSDYINSKNIISQRVVFKHKVNKIKIAIPKNSQLTIYLEALDSGKKIKIKANANNFFTPGNYKLILKNNTGRPQKITISHNKFYQLAPYPLIINKKILAHSSLVYQALWINQKIDKTPEVQ